MNKFVNITKNLGLGFFGCLILGMIYITYYKVTGDKYGGYVAIFADAFWAVYIAFKIIEENKFLQK